MVLPEGQAGEELAWLRDRLVAEALSPHTVNAYLSDLKLVLAQTGMPLSSTGRAELEGALAVLSDEGANPRSLARCLSAVRHFYRLMIAENKLATELGLSKGALYLYFPTKEALFLSLLQGELGAWFTALGQALDGLKPGGEPELVADTISGSLLERPRLVRLLGLMHLVLEQNVDAPTVRTWKLWLLERLTEAGARLERALPRLPPADASRKHYPIRCCFVYARTQRPYRRFGRRASF